MTFLAACSSLVRTEDDFFLSFGKGVLQAFFHSLNLVCGIVRHCKPWIALEGFALLAMSLAELALQDSVPYNALKTATQDVTRASGPIMEG
jgi:hypothetical protein